MKVEFDTVFVVWVDSQDPHGLEASANRSKPAICGRCDLKLEYREPQYAYCPSCKRSSRASTSGKHIYAKDYRFIVRR